MLQYFERKFDLYWDPAQDLSINDKTIGFQGISKNNICITLKDANDDFQADSIFDFEYTYYFIYHNDDIPDSKKLS